MRIYSIRLLVLKRCYGMAPGFEVGEGQGVVNGERACIG